jgi:superfamily II DNA or RNA helicase
MEDDSADSCRNTADTSRGESDNSIVLRDYQNEAIDQWFDNENRGILEMATGTGKTFTAIGAIDRVLDTATEPLLITIAVPYTHLAEQWISSLAEWGHDKTWKIYGTANGDWREDLSRLVSDVSIGVRNSAIVLTTHKTVSTEYFRDQIEGGNCRCMLVGDEVHHMGSEHHRKALSEAYQYRLGLSATPERYYDEFGTSYLLEYFGGIVYSYTLEDAIPEYLTPYEYKPVIVELTEDELAEYQSYSTQIASEYNNEEPDEERLQRLMLQRGRIIKSADQKPAALRELLQSTDDHSHLLVYTNSQQIDDVQESLNEVDIVHHKFTYHEDAAQRAELLDGFTRGAYDALVAMKCLDEGVDVPATKEAVLMSNSNNPMQFIQRRGRVLRRADEFGKEKATIYDLIVVPSTDPDKELRQSEQTIMENQLRRFLEFADGAMNSAEAKNKILPLCTAYQLDLTDLREERTNA